MFLQQLVGTEGDMPPLVHRKASMCLQVAIGLSFRLTAPPVEIDLASNNLSPMCLDHANLPPATLSKL